MMKTTFLIILFIALSSVTFAQKGTGNSKQLQPNVTGRVLSETGESIPFASVAVYDSTETSIITGNASDEKGMFAIRVRPGSYVVKITYLSYKPYTQKLIMAPGATKDLGAIQMEPISEQLDEVVVTGEASQMIMKFDKRIFQVGTDLTNLGGSALNVLDNVPSVTTDIDGNVSLRGSENVRILINGKPSGLVSSGTSSLQNIPASMIERVEVITNPSARYDAEGEAGIINIILKKNRKNGVNGSMVANTGYPDHHGLAANLNYRTESVNWFLNLGGNYRARPGSGSIYQRYASPDTSYAYRQTRDMNRSELSGNVRLGADILLPAQQTLTLSTSMNLSGGTNKTNLQYLDLNNEGNVFQQINRNDKEREDEHNLEFNINYEKKFSDFKDHKLTADASFEMDGERERSDLRELPVMGVVSPLYQRSDNLEDTNDLLFKTDYVHPFSGKTKFETGLKSSYRWVTNNYLVEQQDGNAWVTLPNYNDNFLYDENINAAYGIFSTEFGAFSYQLGLRAEQANVQTELKNSGNHSNQHYLNLFPSTFLTYHFNELQSLQLSYSRRISRPRSRWLLPFSNYSDSRNRFTGNPDLKPEYTNSYELGFLQYWKGGSLFSSAYYRYRTGVIERITSLDDNGISRIYPINLSTQKAWGVEFSLSQDIGKVFSLNGNANLFNAKTDGTHEGELLRSETGMFYGRMGLQWKFLNGWQYQSNVRYRGPRETTQGRMASMSTMDTGLSRELLDGRATLTLSIRDLLDTRKRNMTIEEPTFYSKNIFQWSSRTFLLSFTYRFNQKESKRQNRRRAPVDDGFGGDDFDM